MQRPAQQNITSFTNLSNTPNSSQLNRNESSLSSLIYPIESQQQQFGGADNGNWSESVATPFDWSSEYLRNLTQGFALSPFFFPAPPASDKSSSPSSKFDISSKSSSTPHSSLVPIYCSFMAVVIGILLIYVLYKIYDQKKRSRQQHHPHHHPHQQVIPINSNLNQSSTASKLLMTPNGDKFLVAMPLTNNWKKSPKHKDGQHFYFRQKPQPQKNQDDRATHKFSLNNYPYHEPLLLPTPISNSAVTISMATIPTLNVLKTLPNTITTTIIPPTPLVNSTQIFTAAHNNVEKRILTHWTTSPNDQIISSELVGLLNESDSRTRKSVCKYQIPLKWLSIEEFRQIALCLSSRFSQSDITEEHWTKFLKSFPTSAFNPYETQKWAIMLSDMKREEPDQIENCLYLWAQSSPNHTVVDLLKAVKRCNLPVNGKAEENLSEIALHNEIDTDNSRTHCNNERPKDKNPNEIQLSISIKNIIQNSILRQHLNCHLLPSPSPPVEVCHAEKDV